MSEQSIGQKLIEDRLERIETLKEAWQLYSDEPGLVTDYEEKFLIDNYERYEKFHERTMISDKQLEVLERIIHKINNN